jgi:prevent-host-death family protein
MVISIAEVHNHLSSLLRKIIEGPIHITRWGKTVGVIISPEEYKNLCRMRAYFQMLDLSHELRESISAAEIYRISRQ